MNLLNEPPTAAVQTVPMPPVPLWLLSPQRYAARWRCAFPGLQKATASAAVWTAKWALKTALALAVAGVITACGPGTGGTGVGPVAGTYISMGTANTSASAVPGSAPSTVASASYVLLLEPLAIRLTGACLAFQFDGAWVEANGEIRVTGNYRQAAPASDLALAPALPGTLVARVESTGLTVTLQDARGTLVLSFVTAAKVADGVAVAAAPACKSLPSAAAP